MFSAVAEFVKKYPVYVVVFWLVAAVALYFVAPKFGSVAYTDESQFLPQSTQSAEATAVLNERFPSVTPAPPGSGTIVIYDASGLTSQDIQEAGHIKDWLLSPSAPPGIQGVTSIFDSDLLRQSLISSDHTTMLMEVSFFDSPLSNTTKAAVSGINGYLSETYPHLDAYFTGQTGLMQDLFDSVQQTISRTTFVTIALLLVILLVIYRSPVAALLPLTAIGCSFLMSMGILGFLGQAGMKFFTLVEAYLVVVIFGIGTDYCLFIVSRYREESRMAETKTPLVSSMRHIGPVIAASAVTVIVAFLCLGLSRFGMNQTTGVALAIGIAITLLAGLTLVPALMAIFGKYLFWPEWAHRQRRPGKLSWASVGAWIVRYPYAVAAPLIVLLLVPYVAFSHFTQTNDIVSQMPAGSDAVQGYKLINKHFPPGQLYPLYLLVESPQANMAATRSVRSVESLAQSLQNVPGVAEVDYFSAPAAQLSALAAQFRNAASGIAGGSLENLASLQASTQSLESLMLRYPGIVKSANFQELMTDMSAISEVSVQVSTADRAALLTQLQATLQHAADSLDALAEEFRLEVQTPFSASLRSTYFSADNTTARINVVLNTGPYTPQDVTDVSNLRDAVAHDLGPSGLAGSTYYLGGEGATRADIMLTSNSDFGIVVGSAIVGILLVIMVMLRSVVAPLYMVASVLLNYGATLGITAWIFTGVLKQEGVIYMIPIFIFIILVALGADYNIFLVSRIREEARARPMKDAVSHAVANTGGVITSCGIIIAGTFAALAITPLQMVMQVGAAIFVGILIDTFLVRALLVPSITVLVGRRGWWPSRVERPRG